MPLDVLIATPSGPFGELIRLTLEADPDFHCSLVDNGSEIWSTLQEKVFQAVIFDCSFLEPEPRQVLLRLQDDHPAVTLLLVPSENRTDINPLKEIQADGFIPRPFDSSVLPEQVKAVVEKKKDKPIESQTIESPIKHDSWWNAFQAGIHETAASSGMIVQNGMVVASTPETSTALQQQVTASIARFWSPTDATDLMRYVKDLVTGQEWMMYASQAAGNAVLALLFLPQTPVTKVRSQTLKLAKEISVLMGKPSETTPKSETGFLETSEPPKLREILGETPEEETPRVIKNHFPVEWFKEADLPEFNSSVQPGSEKSLEPQNPLSEESPSLDELNELLSKVTSTQQKITSQPAEDIAEQVKGTNFPPEKIPEGSLSEESDASSTEETISLPEDDLDLGSFQPVSLLTGKPESIELDDIQPVPFRSESPSTPPSPIEVTQPSDHHPSDELTATDDDTELVSTETIEKTSQEPINIVLTESPTEITDLGTPILQEEEAINPPDEMSQDNLPESETGQSVQTGTSPLLGRFNLNSEPIEQQPLNIGLPEEPETVLPKSSSSNLFERMNQLESAAGEAAQETITVALIPRSESMILQRQIAGVLNQTITRLCQAFNWKLDNLTIRPTYMQWTVTIPATLSPEDMVTIVKKETSQELIKALSADFGLTDNDEFWAPESMNATGRDFVPSTHWQDFILRRKTHEIA